MQAARVLAQAYAYDTGQAIPMQEEYARLSMPSIWNKDLINMLVLKNQKLCALMIDKCNASICQLSAGAVPACETLRKAVQTGCSIPCHKLI
eukprot:scaffold271090_cov15-Tisochrysis_lutea.AAC.1